jgi:hypothetical protein
MPKKLILIFFVIALTLVAGTASQAAPGLTTAVYEIPKWTVDGGGSASSGGEFWLVGTAGQPDAGILSGGDFDLVGGLWGGVPALSTRHIYLPVTIEDN